jgi:hypothetical protein
MIALIVLLFQIFIVTFFRGKQSSWLHPIQPMLVLSPQSATALGTVGVLGLVGFAVGAVGAAMAAKASSVARQFW